MSVLQVATVLANLAAKAHSTMAYAGSSTSSESECSSDASSLAEGITVRINMLGFCSNRFCKGSSPTSDSRLYLALPPRINEHLAVLLPRSLWKVQFDADTLRCPVY
jgi:hypothetical protein